MKIVGLRMRSGEDIIGKLVSEDGYKLQIEKPVVPVTSPERDGSGRPIPNGREMLHFLKWVPYATTEVFEFDTVDYVVKYELAKEIEDAYLQVTSSIQIANPSQSKQVLNG